MSTPSVSATRPLGEYPQVLLYGHSGIVPMTDTISRKKRNEITWPRFLRKQGIGRKLASATAPIRWRSVMADEKKSEGQLTREQLIELLNEDLAREYQAIIAYVVYSQVLKGAEYMTIAKELETHAGEELQHALTISKHIDYLGGMPTATPQPVKLSDDAKEMLRADLKAESDTIRAYRERVRQCEALSEF